MMLAGCGQNVYKKGVESLENKDYEAAQENFRKAVEEKKNVADSYRGLGIAYSNIFVYSVWAVIVIGIYIVKIKKYND